MRFRRPLAMRFLVTFLATLISFSAFGQTLPVPTLTAKAWLLMDYDSDQVLAAQEPDLKLEPASLTKVMTTYLVAAALKQKTISSGQPVTISERAWRTYGSRTFLQVGSQATVDDLLKGMVIQSGNDASVALAEAVAGSEDAFADRMNREAQRLGLSSTHFLNASGFFDNAQPAHHSTTRDLAHLAAALIRDHPETHALHSVKEYSFKKIRQQNRNRLLWLDPTVDGLKTGHSSAAGYCLIATAKRGPRRLISVVLGAPSDSARSDDSLKLLNWGYQAFDTVKLHDKNQPAAQFAVFKGSKSNVAAGFIEDFALSLPKDSASRVIGKFEGQQPLIAPVKAGSRVGTLKVSIDGQSWGEYPVLALEDIPLAGFFGRAWDSVRLWFY
jgi:D-alanyl-D-alanine carboxypeptidase (penicillin-binding protein 5/6)